MVRKLIDEVNDENNRRKNPGRCGDIERTLEALSKDKEQPPDVKRLIKEYLANQKLPKRRPGGGFTSL